MEEYILKKDGLSLEKLKSLSYHSDLGIHLKKNLHYFDKEILFKELDRINEWYDSCNILHNYHYPIEIQYNTYYDRQLNNWLHKYIYKRKYDNLVGWTLRRAYESGRIRTEYEFREVLSHVLSDCKEI